MFQKVSASISSSVRGEVGSDKLLKVASGIARVLRASARGDGVENDISFDGDLDIIDLDFVSTLR